MQMLLPILDKASDYLSECLKNNEFAREISSKFPQEFAKINWCQELILELFYHVKDADCALLKLNPDVAMQNTNFEMNAR